MKNKTRDCTHDIRPRPSRRACKRANSPYYGRVNHHMRHHEIISTMHYANGTTVMTFCGGMIATIGSVA